METNGCWKGRYLMYSIMVSKKCKVYKMCWYYWIYWHRLSCWSFLLTFSTGESDSGPGASTPDEPLPGQTHDHPQRRNVTQRWTDADRQHSSLPHPPELLPLHPGCGGEPSASTRACVATCPPLTCLHVSPQVDVSASNLNTNDVFVLKSPSGLFVWRGIGASDEEMEAAKHVVGYLGGSPSQVSEGKEPGGCPLRTDILNVM